MWESLTKQVFANAPSLDNYQLFHNVDPHILKEIVNTHPIVSLPKDIEIIKYNEVNTKLYLVVKGKIGIYRGEDHSLIRQDGPGVVAGEISMLDGKKPSASVTTLTECMMLILDEQEIWALTQASHAFTTNLLRVLVERIRSINQQVQESIHQHKKIETKAHTDSLTGLLNRTWMNEQLPGLYAEVLRNKEPCSILMADLDNFKTINDESGHDAGDIVLKQVASIFKAFARSDDAAIRYGGDELIIVLTNTGLDNALNIANRLKMAVQNSIFKYGTDGAEIQTSISIGVAEAKTQEVTLKELFKLADKGLYKAKHNGRNMVCTAD